MTAKNKMSKAQHIRKTHYSVYRSLDAGELTVLALKRVIGHVKDTLNGNIYFRMYIQIVNAEKITNEVRRIPLAAVHYLRQFCVDKLWSEREDEEFHHLEATRIVSSKIFPKHSSDALRQIVESLNSRQFYLNFLAAKSFHSLREVL